MYSTQRETSVATVSCFLENLRGNMYSFSNPRWVFEYLFQHFYDKFPRHFLFANFQCLGCGECCSWDGIPVLRDDIRKWILKSRYDILRRVTCREYTDMRLVSCARRFLHYDEQNPCENCRGGEIDPVDGGKCPFVAKVKNGPYEECKIYEARSEWCSDYLCEKSLPVAHLHWTNVKELIQKIGMRRYNSLTKKNNPRKAT